MKVLVIDDQPEALKQIESAIRTAKGPDGQMYEVVGLANHQQALERLDHEHFDAVITDMVMGTREDEGMAILKQLNDKSPITIVLTAYPSVPNCVTSMRAGAWDYLEKVPADGSDPYENLLKSLQEACQFRLAHPEAGRSNPDARWVHEHLADLMRQYAGEDIAVLDQKVVDHDRSYTELAERLKAKFPMARPMVVSLPDTKVETVE